MKTEHTCIFGDSRRMKELENNSVHLVVTSPPYWQLKDYGNEEQIGYNQSYQNYINNLNLVWKECYRVLNPGCRMMINIGDQFARAVYYGRYKVIPIRTEIIKFCETIGFDYMGAIIWQKKTTMNTTGGATVMGSYPYPRNGIIEIDYEFILIFKKPGNPPKVTKEIKQKSVISKENWKEYFSGHWYFGGARQEEHIAVFPLELPKRAIEMFTFVGETVLDPFLGSGTTSLAALITNRNSVGYEINKNFKPIIEKKLLQSNENLFSTPQMNFVDQKLDNFDWRNEIAKLEYQFKDPFNFDKKIDPNKLKFGSKISLTDITENKKNGNLFTVNDILDTNLIRLENDVIVRLLGIETDKEVSERAKEFLERKILGRKVYMSFDEIKHDENNRLLAYLYLKNKTFINAHLLKLGLAKIDLSYPLKYKTKFEKLIHSQIS